jgi:hypothetical protein
MAKSEEDVTIQRLKAEIESKDEALQAARNGLHRISGIDPVSFVSNPGKDPAIVKAFTVAKQTAEVALVKMSDAEATIDA